MTTLPSKAERQKELSNPILLCGYLGSEATDTLLSTFQLLCHSIQDGQAQWHHAVALLLWCANVSLKPSHLVGMVDDWALQLTELDMLYLLVSTNCIYIKKGGTPDYDEGDPDWCCDTDTDADHRTDANSVDRTVTTPQHETLLAVRLLHHHGVKSPAVAAPLPAEENTFLLRLPLKVRDVALVMCGQQGSKQASKQAQGQASQQASQQATRQASKQVSKPASQQAIKQASKQASQQASKRASEQASKQASKQAGSSRDLPGGLTRQLITAQPLQLPVMGLCRVEEEAGFVILTKRCQIRWGIFQQQSLLLLQNL
ncbi:MAG: hypothetical protein FRX49_12285 [Trebouxia sp. A1-2]|nr:MAG: hypothetical protein FRX49_12285 [Trebouxia sp. A1-2]